MPSWAQIRMDASHHVSRGAGQSAVAAAAYRAGVRLEDARTQQTHDYTRRYGVVATGLVIPAHGAPDWTRKQLWNAAEAAEHRRDARTARKIEVALPEAMSAAQRQELVQAWAADIAGRYWVAVDWAIHRPDRDGDQRNHHAHLMLTTREIGPAGFGSKAALELSNTDQKRRGLLVGDEAMLALRQAMAERLNERARAHGLALHADARSYAERGIDLEPTRHIGVHGVAMHRQAKGSDRVQEHDVVRARNAAAIVARPELILDLLTQREAVFTRRDIARELHRHLGDADQFRAILARLEASPELVILEPAPPGGIVRLSTRSMIAVEARMMQAAAELAASGRKLVLRPGQWTALRDRHAGLSDEQRAAVLHVTARERIAAIAGIAGGGKSAALAAAREAWEAAGYRVRGAALAGKAAEGLQQASGIDSRTLHALEYGWRKGRDPLLAGDVLVLDEAGMVGSRQMGRLLATVQAAGAKLVLVGDARQLQPIEAGAAFRAIAEQIGVAEIETVRRQREDWARAASQALAKGDVATGLAAYAARGHVRLEADQAAARAAIVRDYLAGAAGAIDGSSLIVAHTNADVRALNQAVRAERQRAGELDGEAAFQSTRGPRLFAEGDRLVFLRNDRALGVRNGTLGTVERAAAGVLKVRLDGGGRLCVEQASYADIDHGYAVTLHKAQGATVDRVYVLASGGMDRHLTYVGLTRHRDTATLYAGRNEFADQAALAARLSRARPKQSTLDYAERRGVETEKSWLENACAWVAQGRDRLSAVWSRAQAAHQAIRAEHERARSARAEAERVAAEALERARREAAERAERMARDEAKAAQAAALADGLARARERFEARQQAEQANLETIESVPEVPTSRHRRFAGLTLKAEPAGPVREPPRPPTPEIEQEERMRRADTLRRGLRGCRPHDSSRVAGTGAPGRGDETMRASAGGACPSSPARHAGGAGARTGPGAECRCAGGDGRIEGGDRRRAAGAARSARARPGGGADMGCA